MIELKDRLLCKDGTSIVTDEYAMKHILKNGQLPDYVKVVESEDSYKYKKKYNIDIAFHEEPDIRPNYEVDEEHFKNIILRLISSPRDDTSEEEHQKRLGDELVYFSSDKGKYLLVKLDKLISEFKQNGVVWGVGRGSSCASYILYLLEVHDINPIKYDIPFNEFSKEK